MRSPLPLIACLIITGCSGLTSEPAVVTGTGPDELLKLRAGPGLGFNVILGLPDGTRLNRQGCVTEVGQRWCAVTLADGPRISGYVAADYLQTR